MNILLTNDDGIYADGILAMYQALLKTGHQVDVVAPSSERSAVGHAITISDPLKVSPIETEGRIAGHAVEGTPADCVKLAVNALLDSKPDLVISGINRGANTGNHIIHSGTVSAAAEATMFGIPSIAVSLDVSFRNRLSTDFSYAAKFAVTLCDTVLEKGGLPGGTLLNVNVPGCAAEKIRGVHAARQARFHHKDEYEARTDPYGRTYYWLKMEEMLVIDPPEDDVDFRLLRSGYVVVCPIHYDLTDYTMLERLKKWDFEK